MDAGAVSHLRSQSLYHGLAHARSGETPNTIVTLTPAQPYVCIGLHQTLSEVIDVEFCSSRGLPIVRREVGGGAVFIDPDQLFVQWIFAPESLPLRLDRRFELFVEPIVATLRTFGIDAELRGTNDVQVAGRKISGIGAARIGAAEVLVANFIFDFDHDTMARVVRTPSPRYRDTVSRSLDRYVTSIRGVLESPPAREHVRDVYLEEVRNALGVELRTGELSEDEERHVATYDAKLASDDFLNVTGGMRRPGLKIHEDVYVARSSRETARGTLTVTASRNRRRLEEVALELNGEALPDLGRALRGVELEPASLSRAIGSHSSRLPIDETISTIMGLLDPCET